MSALPIPEDFLQSMLGVPGFDETAFLQAHTEAPPPLSIRTNPLKFASAFTTHLPMDTGIPWCPNGYYLSSRPSFTLDPLFHAGAYYVQEASSMFLDYLLRVNLSDTSSLRVLDLCAAPGGKSTLIQSLLGNDCLLVSNEVIKARAGILSDSLTRWGASNAVVTQNDPRDFSCLPGYFDVIVIDAPCSGSGLFRKENEAIGEWSLRHVDMCAQRQQRIVADILPSLKEGGLLLYSTCSFSVQEDEDIRNWLLETFDLSPVISPIPSEWNIVESEPGCYRFFPHLLKGEGFFISVFRKNADTKQESHTRLSRRVQEISAGEKKRLQTYCDSEELFHIHGQEDIFLLPSKVREFLSIADSSLYIKKAGTRLGSLVHDELLPDHELALSGSLSQDLARADVDKETALNYLRRHPIDLPGKGRGWMPVCFLGLPLGWVKVLPGRVNNYLPKSWRILNK